jgi:hypothetical protein
LTFSRQYQSFLSAPAAQYHLKSSACRIYSAWLMCYEEPDDLMLTLGAHA